MLNTPKKGVIPEFQTQSAILLDHSRSRGMHRNKLMISPYPEEAFDSFFECKSWVKNFSTVQGIFGEGEERQVSDICYSFIGFNDFM